jgi:Zn-dependent peptidase ImmA (M78 family)
MTAERKKAFVPLRKERADDIIQLAEAVADEYCPTGHVEPLLIAKKNKILTVFNDYGDYFDGMLEHSNNAFCIFCNLGRVEKQDSPRARFTIAHELGHYYIDDHRIALASGKTPKHASRCEFESSEIVEQEADLFASHLLLPTSRFTKKTRGQATGLKSILAAAGDLRASVTSTAIRYVKADFVPCTLIKWNKDGFQWKHLSTETFRARFHKTIELVSQVAEGSATHKAIMGTPPPQAGFFENATTAAAWFPFLGDLDSRNQLFMEQAIPIGRFGVLTLLFPIDGRL